MLRILIVFGTRPEAIKMASLAKAFQQQSGIDARVCVTAQHREMLDQVLDFFQVIPHYDLNLMQPNQSLFSLTAAVIEGLKPILEDFKPQYVFVHGDTTTTLSASLAAFYGGAKVCHVEAGLRTHNKHSPFPEEINRQVTSRIADYHFAPTPQAKQNLIHENIAPENIVVTGNTVIDALLKSIEKVRNSSTDTEIDYLKTILSADKDVVLVTGHRRENFGNGFEKICEALRQIAEARPDILVVYPVHLNPHVQEPVHRVLNNIANIKLISPLAYPAFVWLMDRAKIIITDSGGVQEEAPSLGKPVLVMRNTTERPEAVEAGTVILVGTNTQAIVSESLDLLQNPGRYHRMSQLHNPYGDGNACQRIVDFIVHLHA